MLANSPPTVAYSGTLSRDVHLPATFLHELLAFVADQLPRWRDDPERPGDTSETALTEHLCDYLSGAARLSSGWDILQFRTEVTDEQYKSRKIDLAPKPCGATIWIDGRRHTQYDSLLPIECKRLPTPKGSNRDEREYVFSRYSTTGGIQRFKAGHHGAVHALGAMIGYVQEGTVKTWHERIEMWISDLVSSVQSGWTEADLLHAERHREEVRLAVFHSAHERENGLPKIELSHLWLEMN